MKIGGNFNFQFSNTKSYEDISYFYREVQNQGYKITFHKIPEDYIDGLVETGELHLFQIYNKDFSDKSNGKGMPNLHTLYFKALFDERNLSNVVYKLNGEAEMFYRKKSIKEKDTVIHPKGQVLNNKNPLAEKNTSQFSYDLVKDKRFTKRQFLLHIPITTNFKAYGNTDINYDVRYLLKQSNKTHIMVLIEVNDTFYI